MHVSESAVLEPTHTVKNGKIVKPPHTLTSLLLSPTATSPCRPVKHQMTSSNLEGNLFILSPTPHYSRHLHIHYKAKL